MHILLDHPLPRSSAAGGTVANARISPAKPRKRGILYLCDIVRKHPTGLLFQMSSCSTCAPAIWACAKGSDLEPAVQQLYSELSSRSIRFRPHVWLSDEWFTPDGIPGIAAPFYLAHPRCANLNSGRCWRWKGALKTGACAVLRHEAGHALDNAYRLHARSRYRALFGSWHSPYPDSYHPRPNTKRFVIHLDMWYAQAHPAEDFAETFAVWLNPDSRWEQQYASWPAITKLRYVDSVMRRLAGAAPPVRDRRRTHTLPTLRRTLRELYEQKRAAVCRDNPGIHDRDLRRIFSDDRAFAGRESAAAFLRSIAPEARMLVSRWTGAAPLTINRSMADMENRVEVMGLRLRKPPRQTKLDVMMMLAVQTMNFVNDGKHRVIL